MFQRVRAGDGGLEALHTAGRLSLGRLVRGTAEVHPAVCRVQPRVRDIRAVLGPQPWHPRPLGRGLPHRVPGLLHQGGDAGRGRDAGKLDHCWIIESLQ